MIDFSKVKKYQMIGFLLEKGYTDTNGKPLSFNFYNKIPRNEIIKLIRSKTSVGEFSEIDFSQTPSLYFYELAFQKACVLLVLHQYWLQEN